jgi:DNA polymerase, archaea type
MTLTHALSSLLYGKDACPGLVACEWAEGPEGQDEIILFQREQDSSTSRRVEPFTPFLWLASPDMLDESGGTADIEKLSGSAPLAYLAFFKTWKNAQEAVKELKKKTGQNPSSNDAPYLFINDPVQQYLMLTGRTLFKELSFPQIRRMQVDIETYSTPAYDFSNPERPSDRIIAIALADQSGWTEVLSGEDLDEKSMLKRFVELVQERDPDVLEGHNLFKFDLPYLFTRAKQQRVPMRLGRDGHRARLGQGRFSVGERTINYTKCMLFGRHVADTFFMTQAYDVTHRSLESFGLKEVAQHFGVAAPDRTYVDGAEIARLFEREPARIMAYARDDICETRAVADVLSPVYFAQTQMLPFSYQQTLVRGNGGKIDALMLRAYLHARHAVPLPGEPRSFEGGYTDIFYTGLARHVHHCDVRSLYPSLMLSRRIGPQSDPQGVFLDLLVQLRDMRVEAKRRMQEAHADERRWWDARQTAFKVLINSFYGYLGFSQARFNDYDAAEQVTREGREVLKHMLDWLQAHDAQPVEIDTDGIYFVPPPFRNEDEQAQFETQLQASLSEGIDVEFDGVFPAMFSYKMKNYALLDDQGEILLKGAALKSRGLEPFQRDFLKEMLRLILEDRAGEIADLKARYAEAIQTRAWPITRLAKTETLQDNPLTYQEKIKGKSRGRNAAYELALRSGRDYRAGDQVAYYVTGDKKSIAVYEAAKLVSAWDPEQRDENVPYYLAKLDALAVKFNDALANPPPPDVPLQGELWGA